MVHKCNQFSWQVSKTDILRNGMCLNRILYDNLGLKIRRLRRKREHQKSNRVFSHDVTAAILVFQNNETAAMLVFQTSPLGVELFSYANAFFCSNKFA